MFRFNQFFAKTKKIKIFYTGPLYYTEDPNPLTHFKELALSEYMQNLEELIISIHDQMLDLSIFETLERDRFPKLKNLSVPFLATEISLLYHSDYKENQIYDNWCTKVASPSSLHLTGWKVDLLLGSLMIS